MAGFPAWPEHMELVIDLLFGFVRTLTGKKCGIEHTLNKFVHGAKIPKNMFLINKHFIKYTGVRIISDPYISVLRQNQRFCPYTVIYGSEKTCILTYFTQWNYGPHNFKK